MKIYCVLLFLFNLIIYVFPQDLNCNNSVKIISPESYNDEFYSQKLRLLEDSTPFKSFFLELLLSKDGIKKAVIEKKFGVLIFLQFALIDEPYSSKIIDIIDNFISDSNEFFINITDEIEQNKANIIEKVNNTQNGDFMELLLILLEYERIAKNFGLFIEYNPDLLNMLYL